MDEHKRLDNLFNSINENELSDSDRIINYEREFDFTQNPET